MYLCIFIHMCVCVYDDSNVRKSLGGHEPGVVVVVVVAAVVYLGPVIR